MILSPVIKKLGLHEYTSVWQKMRDFTDTRTPETPDEIWIVEHPPVFTLGQKGEKKHILEYTEIPVVHSDRGGQVTYHGPGQLVVYPLLNLKRLGLDIKQLVFKLEQAIIDLLAEYLITGKRKDNAPGVYVNDAKICSLGLRVRRGFSYHGLAFNLDMDLHPFQLINPCGYQGMQMTQLSLLIENIDKQKIIEQLQLYLLQHLGYNQTVTLRAGGGSSAASAHGTQSVPGFPLSRE